MASFCVARVQSRRKEEGKVQTDVDLSDVSVPLGVKNPQAEKVGRTEVLLESGGGKQTESRTMKIVQ